MHHYTLQQNYLITKNKNNNNKTQINNQRLDNTFVEALCT